MRSTTSRYGVSPIEGAPESPFENTNTPQFGSNSPLDPPTIPQVPNVTTVGNDMSRFKTHSSIGVVISSKSASTLPPRPQIPHRTPFDPPNRSVATDPPVRGRLHSPSSQAALVEGGRIQQREEGVIVSHRQTADQKTTFPRTLAADGINDSTGVIMGDPASLAPGSDWLVSKGRKRASENLPATTIKLGSAKRKMLLCRSTIQRERSREARPTTGELTGVLEVGNSRRGRLADSMVMAQGAEDLLGNTSVGVHGNSKSSALDPPLGFSSAYRASGVENSSIVSDRTSGHKEKGKEKTEEGAEKGSAHAISVNRAALHACLDEAEGLGNSGGATSGGSPTPPHPAPRRRERKRRERKTEEGEDTNHNSSEFGPWSIEAFDLLTWRPPNLDG